MLRKLGQYVLDNPIHAIAVALLSALLPLGWIVAAILVAFVTLCRGYKSGLWMLLGVTIPTLAIVIWKQTILADFIVLRCTLVWLLAVVLRSMVSWRLVLEIMTILGLLTVLAFHWALDDVTAWWLVLLNHYQNLLGSTLTGQLSQEQIHTVIVQMAPWATGLLAALTLWVAFLQLLVARWWQAVMFRPGGLVKEFADIRPGQVLAILFSITAVSAVFGMAFAIDLLPVVILPLVIGGLALLHKWGRTNKKVLYLLAAVYIGLIFLTVLVVAMLTLLSYVDSWYDFRKHYLNHLPRKGV